MAGVDTSRVRLHRGDCRRWLERLAGRIARGEAAAADSCVTDPPYHLVSIARRFGGAGAAPARSSGPSGVYGRASAGFMGQRWDGLDAEGRAIAWEAETWQLVAACLKPGAHLVAFGSPRGYHRMACAIEDAGFEVRDSLLELVARDAAVGRFLATLSPAQQDAFARCLDAAGVAGELAWVFGSGFPKSHNLEGEWDGWGTALKPAYEPIVLARLPLAEGSVAANVLRHGTGAINVDGCRVDMSSSDASYIAERIGGFNNVRSIGGNGVLNGAAVMDRAANYDGSKGRWPANVLHDGSEAVAAGFAGVAAPGQKWPRRPQDNARRTAGIYGDMGPAARESLPRGDSGSAARFFYSAKADAEDRWGSRHPTVKPVALMRWLVRLVTPPGGTVLEPFAGSGSTGVACLAEGFGCLLIERDAGWCRDIGERLAFYRGEGRTRLEAKARRRAPKAWDADSLFAEPALEEAAE